MDIADFVCTAIPSARVKVLPNATDLRDYDVDLSKISQILGYKTEFSVPEGVAEIQERMSEANGISIADSVYINEKMTRQLISKIWNNGHRSQSVPAFVGSAA